MAVRAIYTDMVFLIGKRAAEAVLPKSFKDKTMKTRTILLAGVTALTVSACASTADYRPDVEGPRTAAYENDLNTCYRVASDTMSGDRTILEGALGGAVIGGIIGSFDGEAGEGAAAGAAVGALEGAEERGESREEIIRNCMRNRGHQVLR